MNMILAWSALLVGALFCLANFYWSFVRYPVHRLRGLPPESYRWGSGIPMFGSLLVGVSLFGLHSRPGIVVVAVALIAIDTGGLHWFVGSMIYHSVLKKNRD